MSNKYHAKKVKTDDGVFDSVKEYRRWLLLKEREDSGEISNLRRQVEYELIPVQREPDTVGARGGIKKGKVLEKAAKYHADFVYVENGETVVEDTKSKATRTKDYVIRRKLMLYVHGIRIREV